MREALPTAKKHFVSNAGAAAGDQGMQKYHVVIINTSMALEGPTLL